MAHALKGVPVQLPKAPEGLVQSGGEWFYEEYTQGNGVISVGLEEKAPTPPTEEERKGILDLFKN
jgi:penicillin-binding protein 1A